MAAADRSRGFTTGQGWNRAGESGFLSRWVGVEQTLTLRAGRFYPPAPSGSCSASSQIQPPDASHGRVIRTVLVPPLRRCPATSSGHPLFPAGDRSLGRRLRRAGDPQPEPRTRGARPSGGRHETRRRLHHSLGPQCQADRTGRSRDRPGRHRQRPAPRPAAEHAPGRYPGPRRARTKHATGLNRDLAGLGARSPPAWLPQGGSIRHFCRSTGQQRHHEPCRRLADGDPARRDGRDRQHDPRRARTGHRQGSVAGRSRGQRHARLEVEGQGPGAGGRRGVDQSGTRPRPRLRASLIGHVEAAGRLDQPAIPRRDPRLEARRRHPEDRPIHRTRGARALPAQSGPLRQGGAVRGGDRTPRGAACPDATARPSAGGSCHRARGGAAARSNRQGCDSGTPQGARERRHRGSIRSRRGARLSGRVAGGPPLG